MEQRSGPTAAPVTAQLATGNRNIAQIPSTVAEAAPSVSINEVPFSPESSFKSVFRLLVDRN